MKGRLLSTAQCGAGHSSQAAMAQAMITCRRRGDQDRLAPPFCAAWPAPTVEGQYAFVPRAGLDQMGKPLGQFRQLGFGILEGVDPVARRQFVEKGALGGDILQPDRNDQFFLEGRGGQFLGDIAGLGRIAGKQQHEDPAVFQRLGGGDAPVLARRDVGVIPGLDAFGPQLAVQQPRPGRSARR